LAFFLFLGAGRGGDQGLFVGGGLGPGVARAGNFQRVLQFPIKDEAVPQARDVRLVAGADLGPDFESVHGLGLDLADLGADFVETEPPPSPRLDVQGALDFGVVDLEHSAGVRQAGLKSHVQKPGGRALGFVVQADRLLAGKHQEGVAGDGIQRLDPPAVQHGQIAELPVQRAPGQG
jgi:hypothetical protein